MARSGDVTRHFANIGAGYANGYAAYPQAAVQRETAGIPVDN